MTDKTEGGFLGKYFGQLSNLDLQPVNGRFEVPDRPGPGHRLTDKANQDAEDLKLGAN